MHRQYSSHCLARSGSLAFTVPRFPLHLHLSMFPVATRSPDRLCCAVLSALSHTTPHTTVPVRPLFSPPHHPVPAAFSNLPFPSSSPSIIITTVQNEQHHRDKTRPDDRYRYRHSTRIVIQRHLFDRIHHPGFWGRFPRCARPNINPSALPTLRTARLQPGLHLHFIWSLHGPPDSPRSPGTNRLVRALANVSLIAGR